MSTLQKLSLALVGTAVVFMSANPANAITLTTGGTTPTPAGIFSTVPGVNTVTFESGSAPTSGFAKYSSASGTPTVVQGSVGGQYAAPFGDESNYLTISPIGSNVAGSTGSVTINFAQALDYFGLHWGSVDTYNSIAFFNGSTLLNTFTGSQVPGTTASGNQTSPQDNVFVNFLADPGQTFDKVVLSSSGIAFETDNHSYRLASVPEPTATLGLLAFGVMSAGSFVKRKSKLV
ncbi:Npun_F0296 family exosortase-dependent surface protein [Nostoc sp.]|uniref:Npun_F0296 family exosortase-dependent surface protein n=1 Tax=Nostoc sp. TaxID=1180 RepID=UPI002FFC73B9